LGSRGERDIDPIIKRKKGTKKGEKKWGINPRGRTKGRLNSQEAYRPIKGDANSRKPLGGKGFAEVSRKVWGL